MLRVARCSERQLLWRRVDFAAGNRRMCTNASSEKIRSPSSDNLRSDCDKDRISPELAASKICPVPEPGFRSRFWAGFGHASFTAKAGPKPTPEARRGDRKHY